MGQLLFLGDMLKMNTGLQGSTRAKVPSENRRCTAYITRVSTARYRVGTACSSMVEVVDGSTR